MYETRSISYISRLQRYIELGLNITFITVVQVVLVSGAHSNMCSKFTINLTTLQECGLK